MAGDFHENGGVTSKSGPDTAEMVVAPARALAIESHGQTDTGRVRERNEDQFLIAELAKAFQVQQSSLPEPAIRLSSVRGHLFVVADGMGGHAGGEEASALAIRSVEEHVLDALKWFMGVRGSEGEELVNELQQALEGADTRIMAEAMMRPHLRGMGTTLTMAFYLDVDLFVLHVGDSRAYLYRGGELHRLTRDHTIAEELMRRGVIGPEEVATHRLRHVIVNVVGGPHPGIKVEVVKLRPEPGDRLMLCSDGLTEMVADDAIAELLRTIPIPRDACEALVNAANERGGVDNITVVVADFKDGTE